MQKEDFEKLVEEALDDLPQEYAKRLENVEVVIEDEPSPELRREMNLSSHTLLFGLYKGIPLEKRGAGYTFVLPDKITIFQKPIEAVCTTDEEVRKKVRATVLHEIGHHFGLSDEELDKTKVG